MNVIAVTGSNGKTTTKSMIAHLLSGRWQGKASVKSFNNHIGVPLTLLRADPPESFLVCEVGMNAPGEIAQLGQLVEPDIAVVTNVAEAHLERLGSIERVAEEKLSLLSHLQSGGIGVINVDHPIVRQLLENDPRFRNTRRVTAGEWDGADIRLTRVEKSEGKVEKSKSQRSETEGFDSLGPRQLVAARWEFEINDRFKYEWAVPGRHNILNALCAIGVARRMGLDHAEIAQRLASFELPRMRLECEQIGDIRVINDAYNANPSSMSAAISVLSELPVPAGACSSWATCASWARHRKSCIAAAPSRRGHRPSMWSSQWDPMQRWSLRQSPGTRAGASRGTLTQTLLRQGR